MNKKELLQKHAGNWVTNTTGIIGNAFKKTTGAIGAAAKTTADKVNSKIIPAHARLYQASQAVEHRFPKSYHMGKELLKDHITTGIPMHGGHII